MAAKLKNLRGRDLAKRSPMIYTARGIKDVDDWVERVIEDMETSALEGHIGTFVEEVARIVSGGVKPGSGVDLQLERGDEDVSLYAIQSAPNTKNAGGRRADVESLRRAARPLRAARRHVQMNIAVAFGREKTSALRSAQDVTYLGSADIWEEISGHRDFGARLLKASMALSVMVKKRAGEEVARLKEEARALFADEDGDLKPEALTSPRRRRTRRRFDSLGRCEFPGSCAPRSTQPLREWRVYS
jgi:type II restriction endonuclease EcoO109I-like protein